MGNQTLEYDRSMKAATKGSERDIGINPTVLRWAREWRGRTVEDAAKRIGKKPSDLSNWEAGEGSPTVNQARGLADYYERPFLELFLDAPPELDPSSLMPDYRMHAGAVPPDASRELQLLQEWAERKRLDALDLFDQLGTPVPEVPSGLFATVSGDPERAAIRCRGALRFSIDDQMGMTKSDARSLPAILRHRLEGIGVVTFRRPDLKRFRARGMSIAQFPLPVMVVQSEAPAAQAFTLLHELGHIILRESAISGDRTPVMMKAPVEAWCDTFAAEFLMPRQVIATLAGDRPSQPSASIPDETLARISGILRVSQHAALIRLVQLGYVQESYYWGVKKPLFDAQDGRNQQFGTATYYGSRYRSALGDLYTGLVLEAWSTDRITNHNAAEYMGIKRLDHLDDIRREFQGA